jgi:hypothetical protein
MKIASYITIEEEVKQRVTIDYSDEEYITYYINVYVYDSSDNLIEVIEYNDVENIDEVSILQGTGITFGVTKYD